jgi:hypothetical protein
MPIRIKNSASTDPVVGLGTRIGNKSVTITEVYVKTDQVFPDPTTTTTTTAASGVTGVSINSGGYIKVPNGSTGTANQYAVVPTGGSGATFTVSVDNFAVTVVQSIDTAGSGYSVNDIIEITIPSAVAAGREFTRAKLQVTSVG